MYENSVSERIACNTEARSAEARTARLEEMLAGLASTNTYNIPSAKPFKYLNLLTNHSLWTPPLKYNKPSICVIASMTLCPMTLFCSLPSLNLISKAMNRFYSCTSPPSSPNRPMLSSKNAVLNLDSSNSWKEDRQFQLQRSPIWKLHYGPSARNRHLEFSSKLS